MQRNLVVNQLTRDTESHSLTTYIMIRRVFSTLSIELTDLYHSDQINILIGRQQLVQCLSHANLVFNEYMPSLYLLASVC